MPGSTQSKTRLSRRQQQILEYIRESVISRGFPPSIREIGEAVGLSSSSTVHSHLKSLETKGFLRRNPSKPRSIELLDGPRAGGVRMVEIPVSDPQHTDGPRKTISLPLELVGDQESFLYQIKEPYRNENIVPGDLVIVNWGYVRTDLAYYLKQDIRPVSFFPIAEYGNDLWNSRDTLGLLENEYQFRVNDPPAADAVTKMGRLHKIYKPVRIWLFGFSRRRIAEMDQWFVENRFRRAFRSIGEFFMLDLYSPEISPRSIQMYQ